MVSELRKDVYKKLVFSAILIAGVVIIPLLLGLGRTGFDTNAVLQQFFLYGVLGIGALIGIWFLQTADYDYASQNHVYGTSLSFFDIGESPAVSSKLFNTTTKTILFFTVIFMLLGIYTVYTGTSFSGIGKLGQQFAVFDNIIYNNTLVVFAENLGAAFVLALTMFGIKTYARKRNMSKGSYIILVFLLGTAAFMFYGVVNHLLRYGTSQAALTHVIVFWLLGGLITLLTGSMIPFLIAHASNNTYISLGALYSNQTITVYTVGVMLLLVVIYAFMFKTKKVT